MTRNAPVLLVGLMGLAIAVLGCLYHQETRARSGIEIEINEHGLTMQEK